jgi:dTMP kinase
MAKTRGSFITFEGGEGAGKSTQAEALARRLRTMGIGIVHTREPGGSPGGEIIRHVLLSGAAKPLGPNGEALLFAAGRGDHVDTVIRPALARGVWVVCDRFLDSTRVYQGTLGKLDPSVIRRLEKITVGEAVPDLTFILDLPAEQGLARARTRRGEGAPDRFESEDLAYHETLNGAYREIAKAEPKRCVLIDATRAKTDIAQEVWATVRKRLHPETAPLTDLMR